MMITNRYVASILIGTFLAFTGAKASEPQKDDEGELTEYAQPGDTLAGKAEVAPPKIRRHRLAFVSLGNVIAAERKTVPFALEYEYLSSPRASAFVGASYVFGGGENDLTRGLSVGRRWYFGRDYQGVFLGLSPTFLIGPQTGTPVLLALLGLGGYTLETGPWFFRAQAGSGPGLYWYPSPRYNSASGKYETHTGTLAFSFDLSVGVRF